MHIEERREISELSHGCSSNDDLNAKKTSSSPAVSPTDPAFYNYLNNLSPASLKKSATYSATILDTSLPHPPLVFGSSHMHLERETSSLKGSKTGEVFKVEGDYRTEMNFQEEVHPVAFNDIKSANLNSQRASSSNPQNNSSFHKEMAIGDNTAELSIHSHKERVTEDNIANLSTEVDDILQLASLEQDGDTAINDILALTFEEASPSSTNLDGLFPSDINDTARSTSSQVESQAAKPSFSDHGQARITSSYTNTKSHVDLSKWRVNSSSAGKDFGASDVNTNKRRKKPVSTTESQDCKGCNCKMSRCLKLYCECFKAGSYCDGPCSCETCYNRSEYEDIVTDKRQIIETRNPLAFAPKVVDNFASTKEDENSAASSGAKHRKGCNCKKSKCLKKYCECFQAKVGCSFGCRCVDCQNSFGIRTENPRSEKWKLPLESSYATEYRPQCMNTGSTNHLSADSYQFSSYAHQSLLPWNTMTDISNLMPLSQPRHDETASLTVMNWGRITGDQIQEANITPTIDNSLQRQGYANPSQFHGTQTMYENFPNNVPCNVMNDNHVAHITRDSGMAINIPRADSDNYILPSLHNRSDWTMSTSSFGLTRGQISTMPAVPSFPSVTPYVKPEDAAKLKGKENQRS